MSMGSAHKHLTHHLQRVHHDAAIEVCAVIKQDLQLPHILDRTFETLLNIAIRRKEILEGEWCNVHDVGANNRTDARLQSTKWKSVCQIIESTSLHETLSVETSKQWTAWH